jgi:hypothetical protein
MGQANDRLYDLILEKIEQDEYPSGELMNRLEESIESREQLAHYLDVLMDKVADNQYPSKQMLDRILRLAKSGV